MITAPGRPRTACQTCKAQKIRCSAERPSCARCTRLKQECTYDRIQESSRPRTLRSFRRKSSKVSATAQKRQRHNGDRASQAKKQPSQIRVNSLAAGANLNSGIPESLVPDLVELYFENVYQSDLLLHRASFSESLSRGSVSPHVLLSVCTWGAKFYRDAPGCPNLRDNGSMIEWAKRAGKLVFQDVEGFHEENLVTFFNLAMFWHSQGNWRLSFLYSGNACQLLHIAGLGDQTLSHQNSLQSEIRRRRFWACYLMHCFSPDKLFNFEVIADVETLALPWTEAEYETGFSRSSSTCLRAGRGNGGIFAEVLKGVRLWSSVASLIKSDHPTGSDRLASILALDEEISVWWNSVPVQFKLTASNTGTMKHRALQNLLLINTLYHQSLCALHASIVPLFSWDASEGQWRTARQSSAQIAYQHASTLSSIIDAVMTVHPRPGSMPSFLAYAAYSGCAIQAPFMWNTNSSVKGAAHRAVNANYQMLHAMADEWKLASLLKVYVHCLLDIHKANPPMLKGEPKDCDISSLTDFKIKATLARTSVLAFGGILRSKQRGYVESGQESHDLGIRSPHTPSTTHDEVQSLRSRYEDMNEVELSTQDGLRAEEAARSGVLPLVKEGLLDKDTPATRRGPIAGEAQTVSDVLEESRRQFPNTGQYQPSHVDILGGSVLDLFNPFSDPEMSSLAIDTEAFDFALFDADFLNQDHLNIGGFTNNEWSG